MYTNYVSICKQEVEFIVPCVCTVALPVINMIEVINMIAHYQSLNLHNSWSILLRYKERAGSPNNFAIQSTIHPRHQWRKPTKCTVPVGMNSINTYFPSVACNTGRNTNFNHQNYEQHKMFSASLFLIATCLHNIQILYLCQYCEFRCALFYIVFLHRRCFLSEEFMPLGRESGCVYAALVTADLAIMEGIAGAGRD